MIPPLQPFQRTSVLHVTCTVSRVEQGVRDACSRVISLCSARIEYVNTKLIELEVVSFRQLVQQLLQP